MKFIKFLIALLITLALVVLLNFRLASLPFVGAKLGQSPAASLPPIGHFIDPFNGFWQNAESKNISLPETVNLPALKAPVKVVFDERMVPHIFAENDDDLYFMQGYITAYHRLWQMEFQTHAAAGRVSEIVGAKALDFDKKQRRLGLAYAAEAAVKVMDEYKISEAIVQAYSDGVNAYINQLTPQTLPLEYKLMGYEPEAWSPLKSALLLKNMALTLTGREHDLEMTNALKLFKTDIFKELYEDYPKGQDPIIPAGTTWDFTPTAHDKAAKNKPIKDQSYFDKHFSQSKPDANLGSNNWVVSGKKTATGKPILCNDPHLKLSLPSIWYEIQLHSPKANTYGVSLPGSPCIIIGFNNDIAWGVTNAGRDVKDWYKVKFKGKAKDEYWYEDKWQKTAKRVEVIKIRDSEIVYDTVTYTHWGPVAFDAPEHAHNNLALRWKAHDPSNEILTFYQLNQAKNHQGYLAALEHYECPAQNFVFAHKDGDIAIKQQGKFPIKWQEQGKFVLDGTLASHAWQGYIPSQHNPQSLNPERGFVSSANQNPTDATYPYYYNGATFETYRNRRLNQQLTAKQSITVKDMQQLQTDNYSLQAAESTPTLLSYLEEEEMNEHEQEAYNLLKNWNFMYDAAIRAPSVYDAFWNKVKTNLWDEIQTEEMPLVYPSHYTTIQLLISQPNHPLMDMKGTEEKETARAIVRLSFKQAIADLEAKLANTTKGQTWSVYRGSNIQHIARIAPFSIQNVRVGGNKGILNAMNGVSGPSWRMIVTPGAEAGALGVYPGGQSGNPGSHYYTNFMDKWIAGEYYRLLFMKDAKDGGEQVLFTQTFE